MASSPHLHHRRWRPERSAPALLPLLATLLMRVLAAAMPDLKVGTGEKQRSNVARVRQYGPRLRLLSCAHGRAVRGELRVIAVYVLGPEQLQPGLGLARAGKK